MTRIVVTHLGTSTFAGQVQEFDTERLRLGRRPDNEIVFDAHRDRAVSGHHAELFVDRGAVHVSDLGSQNGTWVNDTRITAPVALAADDVVRFGEEGPEFKAACGTDAAPLQPRKSGVGEQTLKHAIDSASVREGRRSSRKFMVVGALVVVACVAGLLLLQSERQKRKDEQARLEREQKRIDAKVTANREAIAKLERDLDARIDVVTAAHEANLKKVEGTLGLHKAALSRLVSRMQTRVREIGALRREAAQLRATDTAGARRLETLATQQEDKIRRLRGEMNAADARLRVERRAEIAAQADRWKTLAKTYERGIFVIVYYKGNSFGIGTAFCVRADGLLATNGHVEKPLNGADKMLAVQSSTGHAFKIQKHRSHPKYKPGFNSPDVALIKIDAKGTRFPVFPLATDAELRRVTLGTHVGTIGFPGEYMKQYTHQLIKGIDLYPQALATFKDGWIGRVMSYLQTNTTFAHAKYYQHSCSTSGGTSGSPLFDRNGKVIGVHHAGRELRVVTGFAKNKQSGNVEAIQERLPSSSELMFAIRADELRWLIRDTKW